MINASLLSYLAAFRCSISIISLVNVLCEPARVQSTHTSSSSPASDNSGAFRITGKKSFFLKFDCYSSSRMRIYAYEFIDFLEFLD